MKTFKLGLAVLTIISITITQSFSAYASPAVSLGLTDIISKIESPKDLSKFMKKNFKFVHDDKLFKQVDYWQAPEEFLERKKGDCEDYALFSKHILEQKGIEAFVVSLYGGNGIAHTITVFKDGDRFNVMNEDRLYRYKAKTIEDAITRVEPRWTWGAVAEKRGTRGWIVQRLRNPSSR